MNHGFNKRVSTNAWWAQKLVPLASAQFRPGKINIPIHETYYFQGYKPSIIEFLLDRKDGIIRVEQNEAKDEYGTGFERCTLKILISEAIKMARSPGEAINEEIRRRAGGLATGAISGFIGELGKAGKAIVDIYDLASGLNGIAKTQGLDIQQEMTKLAAKQRKIYKNKIARQLHHAVNERYSVRLSPIVSPSEKRASKIIETNATAMTFGALAVILDARGDTTPGQEDL